MIYIISAIGFLNIVDLCATVEWIIERPDLEGNQMMQGLWLYSPGLFVFVKIMITILFCFVAYKLRNIKLMQKLIWIPFVAYSVVTVMHGIVLL
jgi:hypothetical protein